MRVLYFSVVNIASLKIGNGGNACCRNHIRRMDDDPNIDLHVLVTGDQDDEGATREFLDSMQVPNAFIPVIAENVLATDEKPGRFSNLRRSIAYLFEEQAYVFKDISRAVREHIAKWKIDALVIDYLPSALFCKDLLKGKTPTLLITLNREGEFYRDLRELGVVKKGKLGGAIAQWRWDRFEKWAYRRVDKVVTIGPPDIPKISQLRSTPTCVTPYLDPVETHWSYTNSQQMFFLGNIHHYPNRRGIEWIATKLVPELQKLRRDNFKLTIVGASESDVPPTWIHPEIHYAGISTREHVVELFSDADLFLCPIENTYGVKFKSAEAVSYGIPLLASKETLLGLPYLKPLFDLPLDSPINAAKIIDQVLENGELLQEMSQKQTQAAKAFIASQKTVWSDLIRTVMPKKQSIPL